MKSVQAQTVSIFFVKWGGVGHPAPPWTKPHMLDLLYCLWLPQKGHISLICSHNPTIGNINIHLYKCLVPCAWKGTYFLLSMLVTFVRFISISCLDSPHWLATKIVHISKGTDFSYFHSTQKLSPLLSWAILGNLAFFANIFFSTILVYTTN